MLVGWFGPLGIFGAVLAALALFLWPPGFWLLIGVSVAVSIWFFWSLRNAPRIELPTLSPVAQDLLERYNHAWSAPGLTRGFSFLLSIGQVICIAAGLYFAIQTRWAELAILFVVYNVYSYFVGAVNPQLYMRRHGLSAESHEIATAYVEHRKRQAEAYAASRARLG